MTKKNIWDVYGKIRKMDNKNTISDDILNFMTNTAIKKLNENKDKDEIFNTSIEELDFTVRTSNCLRSVKIYLVSDLVNCTRKYILELRNMGHLSLSEIEQKLELMGLSLKEMPIVKELSTIKKIVGIDFIPDEFEDIKNKAKEKGLSISEYISILKINK